MNIQIKNKKYNIFGYKSKNKIKYLNTQYNSIKIAKNILANIIFIITTYFILYCIHLRIVYGFSR